MKILPRRDRSKSDIESIGVHVTNEVKEVARRATRQHRHVKYSKIYPQLLQLRRVQRGLQRNQTDYLWFWNKVEEIMSVRTAEDRALALNLVNSFPNRVNALRASNGGPTGY